MQNTLFDKNMRWQNICIAYHSNDIMVQITQWCPASFYSNEECDVEIVNYVVTQDFLCELFAASYL